MTGQLSSRGKPFASEQEVLQLGHVDVALVLRVFDEFLLLHEAGHDRVGLGLGSHLGRAAHRVVHLVHLRHEHLRCRRLLPSEPSMWLIITFTILTELLLLLCYLLWLLFLSQNWLFIKVKVVLRVHYLWRLIS